MRLALLTLLAALPIALLDRDAHAQPANDACASAIAIGALPYTDARSLTGATAEVDDPTFECEEGDLGGEPSVWYRYTASQAISLQIDTFGSAVDTDTLLAVHEGVCGLFTEVRACNNDDFDIDNGSAESRVIVTLAAGETLYVEVIDRQEGGGAYTLNVTESPVVQVSRFAERGHSPSIATAPGGGFMVVWRGRDPFGEDPIFGRKLSPTGLPAGARFPVNAAPSDQAEPTVSSSASDLVAVWRGTTADLVGRRIDPSGMPVGGEFTVDDDGGDYPRVAADPLGNFLVVWEDGDGIRARLFDALNVPQGSSFQVNTSTDGWVRNPSVAADGDGNFVVVWDGEDDDGDGVLGQRIAGTGLPIGTEFQVNSTATGTQRYGSVAADPDGGFLVAWADDECFYCVDARGFDASGAPVGPSVRIDDGNAANTASHPIATSVDGNGTFTVAWTDDYQIVSRRLDAAATPLGNTFIVSPYRDGYLYNPVVAAAAGGEFVVSWEWSPYGSHYDVMARLVQPSDDPPCPATPVEDCRQVTMPGKSTLVMKNRLNDRSDSVTWKWARGSATTLADFGNPLADGTYRFCIYDDDELVLGAAIPEGGTCGAKPCWKAKGAKGFAYTDGTTANDGIKSIVLRAGDAGKASITVKGQGEALRGPELPFREVGRGLAQIVAGNGVCWETPYADFDVNTPSDFKAVGP